MARRSLSRYPFRRGLAPEIWEPFATLRSEIERIFDEFFGPSPTETAMEVWAPAVDIEETDNEYIIRAELPGMKKEDIKINLQDNTLVISGERKRSFEEKGRTYHRVEMAYGRFERVIPLPAEVDVNKVKATYKDGILTVTLPKKEEAKPKEIEIEVK